jgi:hypothetical protein
MTWPTPILETLPNPNRSRGFLTERARQLLAWAHGLPTHPECRRDLLPEAPGRAFRLATEARGTYAPSLQRGLKVLGQSLLR